MARLRARAYTNLDQFDRAIAVGLDYLRSVGIDCGSTVTEDDVLLANKLLSQRFGSRPVEALADLPTMTDPVWIATMEVLTALIRPTMFSDESLFRLVVIHMADLSLAHGNADGSYVAYMFLGILLTGHHDRLRFGRLGIDLAERSGSCRFRAIAYLEFGNRVIPWSHPLKECRCWLETGFSAAQEAGESFIAAYTRSALISNLLAAGEPLANVQQQAAIWFEFARNVRADVTRDQLAIQLGLIAALRGLAPERAVLECLPSADPRARPSVVQCYYWISEIQLRFHAGDTQAAIMAAAQAAPLLWTLPSHIGTVEYHFYAALSIAGHNDVVAPDDRTRHLQMLAEHHRQLTGWADHCPQNFASQAALVAAEVARIEGRDLDAMHHYEAAIRLAREHGFVQREAVANELGRPLRSQSWPAGPGQCPSRQRPPMLRALGRHGQGAADRRIPSPSRPARGPARTHRDDRRAHRATRRRHHAQGLPGALRRDRPRRIDRHPDAHRPRTRRCRTRCAGIAAQRRTARRRPGHRIPRPGAGQPGGNHRRRCRPGRISACIMSCGHARR